MSQILSAKMSDIAELQIANNKLFEEVKALREELSLYKPQVEIELNLEEQSIHGKILQFKRSISTDLEKEDIDYYGPSDQAQLMVDVLVQIYKDTLKTEIERQLFTINQNLKLYRNKGLW